MATTPKIWLMGPDPTKQCCACGSKTGPCDSCFNCSGERYNVDFAKWYVDTLFLTGVIPAHCFIAQNAADSNTITDKSVSISIDKTGPFHNNVFTNRFSKGSGNANGSFALTTATKVLPYAAHYGDVGFPLQLFFPAQDSGQMLIMYGNSSSNPWATGTAWDFNLVRAANGATIFAPPPVGLSPLGVFFGNTPGQPYIPIPNHVYAFAYNGGSGLAPIDVGSFFDGGDTFFTPYSVGGIQAQRINGSTWSSGPTSILTGATGSFLPDVGGAYQSFSAGIGSRSWRCDVTEGQFSWDASAGPFGDLSTNGAAMSAYESMMGAYVAALAGALPLTGSSTDGNRTLGYTAQLVGQPGYAGSPLSIGVPCNGGNLGQVLTYGGTLDFQLYSSTKWPFQGFNASVSNALTIKVANADSCINIVISGGGTGFNGNATIVRNATFSYTQDQSLSIAPLVFITGANFSNLHGAQEPCPFSLP